MPFTTTVNDTLSLRIRTARGRLLSAVNVLSGVMDNPRSSAEDLKPARTALMEVCTDLQDLSNDVNSVRQRVVRMQDKDRADSPFTD